MLSVTGAGLPPEKNCFQLSRYYGDPRNRQVMAGAPTWFLEKNGTLTGKEKAGELMTKTACQKKDLSARNQRPPQVITPKMTRQI